MNKNNDATYNGENDLRKSWELNLKTVHFYFKWTVSLRFEVNE